MPLYHFLMGHASPQALAVLSVLLYVGPDQILPVTSALAAVIGFLLICWRQVVAFVTKLWHRLFRR